MLSRLCIMKIVFTSKYFSCLDYFSPLLSNCYSVNVVRWILSWFTAIYAIYIQCMELLRCQHKISKDFWLRKDRLLVYCVLSIRPMYNLVWIMIIIKWQYYDHPWWWYDFVKSFNFYFFLILSSPLQVQSLPGKCMWQYWLTVKNRLLNNCFWWNSTQLCIIQEFKQFPLCRN